MGRNQTHAPKAIVAFLIELSGVFVVGVLFYFLMIRGHYLDLLRYFYVGRYEQSQLFIASNFLIAGILLFSISMSSYYYFVPYLRSILAAEGCQPKKFSMVLLDLFVISGAICLVFSYFDYTKLSGTTLTNQFMSRTNTAQISSATSAISECQLGSIRRGIRNVDISYRLNFERYKVDIASGVDLVTAHNFDERLRNLLLIDQYLKSYNVEVSNLDSPTTKQACLEAMSANRGIEAARLVSSILYD